MSLQIAELDRPPAALRCEYGTRLDGIACAIGRLGQTVDMAQLLGVLEEELRACGLAEVRVSTVFESTWNPGGGAFVPLATGTPEGEAVRRRRPVLISAPDTYARDNPETVLALLGRCYVTAPVFHGDRAIALVHAAHGPHRTVDTVDLHIVATLAECASQATTRITAQARLASVQARIRGLTDGIAEEVQTLCGSGEQIPIALRDSVNGEGRLAELLTPRELEVLRHMADGRTNAAIARALTISESTVKSHVKHILRKMRATNRAQAIARYLRFVHQRQDA